MMKINFSLRGVMKAKVVMTSAVFALCVLFFGVSLSAQVSSKETAKADKALIAAYGSDFQDAETSSKLLKQSIALTSQAQPTSPMDEVQFALDLTFAYAMLENLSEGSGIFQALNNSKTAAVIKQNDFTVSGDVDAIFEKYYDLLTL